jgi:peptidoglycan/xylan/chitin deacetylase (PgdA/CDA1 family)
VSAPEPDGWSVVGLEPPTSTTVLTYDDGPTPGVTDELLPLLAEAGVTATFFVLLTRVRPNVGLLREVLAAGHEIALHGPDHLRLTSLPPEAHAGRFAGAKAELEDLAGVPVRWSRPPYGAQDAVSWRAARDAGLQPVLWRLTCLDWETHPSDHYLSEIRATDPAGAVLLLHDGYADQGDGVDDGPAPVLDRIALTRSVLDELAGRDLAARSLGDALGGAEVENRPWLEP